jgi:hypothetical protein
MSDLSTNRLIISSSCIEKMEPEMDPTVRRKTAPLRFAPARRTDSQKQMDVDNVVTLSGGEGPQVLAGEVSAAPQDDSEFQILSFKVVKDVPVSLYEFRNRNRKFDLTNALRGEIKREQLNIYGKVCETAVKEEAVVEASKLINDKRCTTYNYFIIGALRIPNMERRNVWKRRRKSTT